MENTKTLLESSLEKRAYIGQGLIKLIKAMPGNYARNFQRLIADPIKKKGIVGGMGEILKREYVPRSFVGNLQNKKTQLEELAKSLGMSNNPADLIARNKLLRESIPALQTRLSAASQPGYMGKTWENVLNPAAPIRDRMTSMGEIGRYAGDRAMTGANTAFMWGLPAMGAYQVATAPEGERARTLGTSLGEIAGFTLGGPIGLIPSIAGSNLLAEAGGRAGAGLGELISPTPPKSKYKQFIDQFLKQPEPYVPPTRVPAQMVGQTIKSQQRGRYSPLSLGAMDPSYMTPNQAGLYGRSVQNAQMMRPYR